MKVTLDLTKQLNEGAITAAEHDRLRFAVFLWRVNQRPAVVAATA